jgi:hypothetical protein
MFLNEQENMNQMNTFSENNHSFQAVTTHDQQHEYTDSK